MDPNANVQERIDLMRMRSAGNWSVTDQVRYGELVDAYGQWRRAGGFSASRELLDTLSELWTGRRA